MKNEKLKMFFTKHKKLKFLLAGLVLLHPLFALFHLLIGALVVGGASFFSFQALADAPKDWQIGFQDPASPVAEQINHFHNYIVLPVIIVITLLVIGLMFYICIKFSEKNNPTPSKRTHHRNLEIIWTVIPAIILGVIFVPSFAIMKMADRNDNIDMTLKVTGSQWYWSYEYPDHENIAFDSYILADDELKNGKRLLETDNPVVLPVGKNIRLLITASDVLHNWAVPALAVRLDANPGKLNETWVRIDRPGTYYGFCSELCGTNHSYMPIQIEAVSVPEFQAWVQSQQSVASTQ